MGRAVVALVGLLSLTAWVGAALSATNTPTRAISHGCGHARWNVKTLADRPKLDKDWQAATVEELGMKDTPAHVGNNLERQVGFGRVEFTTFRVDARLVGWKISPDDQDIHFVIRDLDTNHTLIAEFPADACVPTADPATGQKGTRKIDRVHMSAARAAVTKGCSAVKLSSTWRKLRGTIRLVGVGFFDKDHGQKLPAPNRIELHPVLGATL